MIEKINYKYDQIWKEELTMPGSNIIGNIKSVKLRNDSPISCVMLILT